MNHAMSVDLLSIGTRTAMQAIEQQLVAKGIESLKEQEAHYMKEENNDPNVNLTNADFCGKKEFAQLMDAPDFD